MAKASLFNALLALVVAAVAQVFLAPETWASSADHIASITFASGKTKIVYEPGGYLTLDARDYSLQANLILIKSIVKKDREFDVTFNSAKQLDVRRITGTVNFISDFGPGHLQATSIARLRTVNTLYGVMAIPLSDIRDVEPLHRPKKTRERRVSITYKDGKRQAFDCSDVEFVRYPDKIYDGTTYRAVLGAWYWYRSNSIDVKTEDSTVNVWLEQVNDVRLSGKYPSWNISVTASRSGARLAGTVVPGPVGSPTQTGIASWDKSREGFWFDAPGEESFLFVPAASISEVRLGPAA